MTTLASFVVLDIAYCMLCLLGIDLSQLVNPYLEYMNVIGPWALCTCMCMRSMGWQGAIEILLSS